VKFSQFISIFVLVFLSSSVLAELDPGYEKAKGVSAKCPDSHDQGDAWAFLTCECVSYVAYRINSDWDNIYKSGMYHQFNNAYFLSDLSTSEKKSLGLPPNTDTWGDASNWRYIAMKIGVPLTTDKPWLGMVAWFSYGHVAFASNIGTNPSTGNPGVSVDEYNYVKYSFSDRWLDTTGKPDSPEAYLDFTAFEYMRLVINKKNHPDMFVYDDTCRVSFPSSKVERFRTNDADHSLLRSLAKKVYLILQRTKYGTTESSAFRNSPVLSLNCTLKMIDK
jgi:hypothetical protein